MAFELIRRFLSCGRHLEQWPRKIDYWNAGILEGSIQEHSNHQWKLRLVAFVVRKIRTKRQLGLYVDGQLKAQETGALLLEMRRL